VLNDHLVYLFLLPGLLFLIGIVIFPTVYALYVSTTEWSLIGAQGEFIRMSNYHQMVHDYRFLLAFGRTVAFTAAAISIELLLGLLLALGLSRLTRHRNKFLSVFLVPFVIAPAAVAYAFSFLMNPQFGMINYLLGLVGVGPVPFLGTSRYALPSLILVDVWQYTPFMFLVIYAGLEALPQEPFEAARMDGASAWQRFKWVTLPLLKPVIAIAVLIRGMDAFRAFDKFYIMTGGGPGISSEVLSLYAYRVGFANFDFGYATAISMFMLFVIIVASWLFVNRTGIISED
jgi:multiple sugar transport system permease protein